jgi:peptidoglycan/LPS O-acetylase OafA/YrhL
MYIFHWPLVVLGVPLLLDMQKDASVASQMLVSGTFVVAGIVVIWALASLSFRFFETPFLSLKKKFHDG